MLGWLGLLGKLVEFSITKIAEKKIDLALDQRKHAAKTFLRLHESLEKLSQASMEFIYQSRDGLSSESRRVLYRVPIEKIAKDIDNASTAFFSAFEDLNQIILLYDEDLYSLLWGVRWGKQTIAASFLSKLSAFQGERSFKISTDKDPQKIFIVDYSAPSNELLNANLEDLYRCVREFDVSSIETRAFNTRSKPSDATLRWPKELLFSLVQNSTLSAQFADSDYEEILKFTQLLEEHIKLLESARKSLAIFIKENFSLDDLLALGAFTRRY